MTRIRGERTIMFAQLAVGLESHIGGLYKARGWMLSCNTLDKLLILSLVHPEPQQQSGAAHNSLHGRSLTFSSLSQWVPTKKWFSAPATVVWSQIWPRDKGLRDY